MIHERRQEGEECNVLKEMSISLWNLHSIKNTAADMSIQGMESKKEKLKEKRKLEWRTKSKVLTPYEKDLLRP